jgi:hypothetical protein
VRVQITCSSARSDSAIGLLLVTHRRASVAIRPAKPTSSRRWPPGVATSIAGLFTLDTPGPGASSAPSDANVSYVAAPEEGVKHTRDG